MRQVGHLPEVNVVILTTAGCGMMHHHSLIVYSVHSPVPPHCLLLLRMRDIVLLSCHLVSLHDTEDGHCTVCSNGKGKGKGHPCTDTEALYRPYGL